jgi:hypothetical protein
LTFLVFVDNLVCGDRCRFHRAGAGGGADFADFRNYYLRVVIVMYMRPGEPEVERDPWLQVTTGVAAVGTVVLGLFAQPILNWASLAVLYLF